MQAPPTPCSQRRHACRSTHRGAQSRRGSCARRFHGMRAPVDARQADAPPGSSSLPLFAAAWRRRGRPRRRRCAGDVGGTWTSPIASRPPSFTAATIAHRRLRGRASPCSVAPQTDGRSFHAERRSPRCTFHASVPRQQRRRAPPRQNRRDGAQTRETVPGSAARDRSLRGSRASSNADSKMPRNQSRAAILRLRRGPNASDSARRTGPQSAGSSAAGSR